MSHRRSVEDKRRLKKLCAMTNGYLVGAFQDRNGVYRRWWPYSANVNRKKQLCKISNRCVRRRKLDRLNGGLHKRVYDLWWELF